MRDFFVSDSFAVESITRSKGEPRNDDAAKVEHQAVGVRHHRHVTRVASGSAKEADDFFFPRATRQLDHVLGRGGDVIIVNWRSNENAVSAFDGRAQIFRTGHIITFVCIAQRQVHFADVDPVAIDFLFLQMRERSAPHPPAVAVGIAAGANDKVLWHRYFKYLPMKRWLRRTKLSFLKNSWIIFENGRVDATVGWACFGSDDKS